MFDIMGDVNDGGMIFQFILWLTEPIVTFLRFLGDISPWLAFSAIVIWWFITHKK